LTRAEEDHPVLLSHVAKYRSLMPSLALIFHLIDGDQGSNGCDHLCRAEHENFERHGLRAQR